MDEEKQSKESTGNGEDDGRSDGDTSSITEETASSLLEKAVKKFKKVIFIIFLILIVNKNIFAKAINHVTLEPMLFLKMVAEGNTIVVGDTLEIDRVCRINLNFSQEDCMAMDDGNHSDVQVKDLK